MAMVILTLTLPGTKPTLSNVMRRFGLGREEIDQRFGVRVINTNDHLYAIKLAPDAVSKVRAKERTATTHSNLRVRAIR
jgi:hypothetical protein